MTSRIQLEPEAQAFVEAAAEPPWLFTLGPEQGTMLAHVGSEVKGIIMARTKSAVTRLRLCAHSNMALY